MGHVIDATDSRVKALLGGAATSSFWGGGGGGMWVFGKRIYLLFSVVLNIFGRGGNWCMDPEALRTWECRWNMLPSATPSQNRLSTRL